MRWVLGGVWQWQGKIKNLREGQEDCKCYWWVQPSETRTNDWWESKWNNEEIKGWLAWCNRQWVPLHCFEHSWFRCQDDSSNHGLRGSECLHKTSPAEGTDLSNNFRIQGFLSWFYRLMGLIVWFIRCFILSVKRYLCNCLKHRKMASCV